MDDADNKHWPKTPDGVTDWEQVFEDPKTGLIDIACRSDSPEQPKNVSIIIIKKLFKRESDQVVAGKLIAYVEKSIPDGAPMGAMDALRANTTKLMCRIKEDRIQRAAAYAKKKKPDSPGVSPARQPERRSGTTSGLAHDRLFGRYGMIAAEVAACVLVGFVIAYVVLDSLPQEDAFGTRETAWVHDYISEHLPSDQWQVTAAGPGKAGSINVDIHVKDKMHVRTIMSFNPMARTQFITELCPPRDSGVMKIVDRGWRIWINLKTATDVLTDGTCRY